MPRSPPKHDQWLCTRCGTQHYDMSRTACSHPECGEARLGLPAREAETTAIPAAQGPGLPKLLVSFFAKHAPAGGAKTAEAAGEPGAPVSDSDTTRATGPVSEAMFSQDQAKMLEEAREIMRGFSELRESAALVHKVCVHGEGRGQKTPSRSWVLP